MTPVIYLGARFSHDHISPSLDQADAESHTGMSEPNYEDVLRTLDALPPGRTFVLTSPVDLEPLLCRLQADRPRQFDWSELEAGPAHYRVDAILVQVTHLVRQGAHQDTARTFAEFACGLNWHIDAKEQSLFPAFEEKTGICEGPTKVLRADHRLMRRHMAEVTRALDVGDALVNRIQVT